MRRAFLPKVVGRPLRERLRPIAEFAQAEATSGILLMICTVAALFWANSPWSDSYTAVWKTRVVAGIGTLLIDKDLIHWINDGLMAIFFFLVGLEIKRELLIGELSSRQKALLPILAAIGGMVVPALIYTLLNFEGAGSRGWGVPMATDIAFALGVLALLGSRVPFALKVFVAAVAIVDDIGAVLVIALFYTSELNLMALSASGGLLVVLLFFNNQGVRSPIWYVIVGVAMWVAFLKSGVHATIAGVLLALTIPTRVHMDPVEFSDIARGSMDDFDKGPPGSQILMTEERQMAVRTLEKACERVQMPLERIEDVLQPWVTFFVMPLFALANAGVSLSGGLAGAIGGKVGLGVILGLVLGKPLGITLFSYLAVKTGLAKLPSRVGWRQIVGVGVIAGIGFTMALFIAELAFRDEELLRQAKIAILTASAIAGVLGFALLLGKSRRVGGPKPQPKSEPKPSLGS